MSAPQPRHDAQAESAERDGVAAAEKLVGTVERHLSDALSFAAVMDDDSFRAISAMTRAIEAISDYILTACPTCGARHLTQPAGNDSSVQPPAVRCAAPVAGDDAGHDPTRGRGPLISDDRASAASRPDSAKTSGGGL